MSNIFFSLVIPGIPNSLLFFERHLKRGMQGEDVRYLQIFLNWLDKSEWTPCGVADTGPGSPGEETDYFGPLTEAAVICFQEKYAEQVLQYWGLEQGTGYFGDTSIAQANNLLIEARRAAGSGGESTRGVQLLDRPMILSTDSAVWRIAWGEPESVEELAASVGLDFIVIGDIRDVVKEGWLYVTNDPEFSPGILGLAGLGILTTGNPTDPVISAGKALYKNIGKIALKSRPVAELLVRSGKALIKSMDKEGLDRLVALSSKLKGRGDLSAYEELIDIPGNPERLAKYVDEGGDDVLLFTERGVTRFHSLSFQATGERLTEHLTKYPERLLELKRRYGLPETATNTELAEKLNQALQNPQTREVVYRHWDNVAQVERDAYGFYTDRGVFLAFGDSGNLITTFPASWDYVMKGQWALEIM
ncbi:MAG: peptidoglycan-binding domain-containing protein [Patescibacteria group bacterium]